MKSWLLMLLMFMGAGNAVGSRAFQTELPYSVNELNGTETSVWVLVTDASTLAAGDKVLIVNNDVGKALSTDQKSNNRGAADVTIFDNKIAEITSDVQEITLEGESSGWYFNVGDGYLYAASSSSNYLRTQATKTEDSKAKIEITNAGVATIKFQGNYTRNWLRYNTYSVLFSCYGSGQADVSLYRYEQVETDVPVESVSLDVTSALLKVDDELQLTATVLPEEATDKSVTWTSSDEDVAMVDDGYVLAVGAGTAMITVTTNDGGMTATCEITVSEGTEPVIALSDTSLDFGEVEIGETQSLTFTLTPANLTGDLTITVDNAKYTVSPATILQDATTAQTITVTAAPTALSDDMTGLLTIRGGGLAEEYTVNLTAIVVGKNPNLIVEDPFEMEVTTERLLDELYITDSDGEVSITVSDESIAKIESGMLKAIKPGNVSLTVKVAATTVYAEASEDILVTVVTKPAVEPVGSDVGSYYVLVTDASILTEGDKVLIVNKDAGKALSTDQKTSNRGSADVTITGDNKIVEIPSDVQEITLEGNDNGWYFNVGSGYLYAASSSANQLKTQAKKDDNAKAEIEINDAGIAKITFQGDNSRNKLYYNSSANLFACYSTNQKDVSLYRYTEDNSFDVHIGATGWRTLVSAKDVSVPAGYRAYIVTTNDGVTAYLTSVRKIKNNTPVLLQGPANSDCTLTLIDEEVDYPSENLLQISTETTGNGVYVLANKSKGVGFYLWTGGALGAGRVYLTLPVDGNAHEFISFGMDDEAAIETVAAQRTTTGIFDLQGRRVTKPAAGLYIVNGRKVFIK